jgi:hypothetical protein
MFIGRDPTKQGINRGSIREILSHAPNIPALLLFVTESPSQPRIRLICVEIRRITRSVVAEV